MKTKYLFCLNLCVVLLALGLNFTPAGAAVGAEGAGRNALPGQTNATIGLVYTATVDDSGNLYVGGYFDPVRGAANHIYRLNGSSWSPLGSGMNGPRYPHGAVYALAVSGTNLYAGGYFTTAGGIAANNIAQWNGSSWSPLGSGMNDSVSALAVSGTNLYAGGYFTNAGGSRANYIAKWNGSSWSALGAGINLPVWALAASGTNLYAGGIFTMAGGNAANYIARWNGSRWSPLDSGVNHIVRALAVSGGTLYAGGEFTTAGGITANKIARWNGSRWSALGLGLGTDYPIAVVDALTVSGTNLYAAYFCGWSGGPHWPTAGPATNYVAQWNGSWWRTLGPAMARYVNALAVSGTNLYAGGAFLQGGGNAVNFTQSWGGNPADYVVHWNGSRWSGLGAGVR